MVIVVMMVQIEGAIVNGECPLSAIHMLWISLICDIGMTLALAIEKP